MSDAGTAADARGDLGRTLVAYAELVRVPNLFTAPPDVILGAALVAGARDADAAAAVRTADPEAVAGLAVASTLLYAAGTTLNDAFDAPADASERPERPIPSGRVSRTAAFGLGGVLLAAGVVVAGGVAGFVGGAVAAVLAAVIVLYDGLLKGSGVGFLTMGLTRGLNVGLGTTAGLPRDLPSAFADAALPAAVLAVPAVVVVYIATVTYMAAGETEEGGRGAVTVAAAGALVAVFAVAGYLAVVGPGPVESVVSATLAAAFLWWVGRPLRGAYGDPVPETVGPAVGACVLGLVILDAAFAAGTGLAWAAAALAFLVPAVALSRVFDVS
ncbi:4-hydroxybenzoate polyprenyltransferase [Halobacteriales archaeon QS_1_68_20]|nr:MAG: 4-hydroxybenzoate polyprenyltransferase [Halobacteriales archaeon QS_1_68_20]